MGTIILAGSHVGDNVIIGAGSIVRGNIPGNSVVAGNPARVVYSLEEYLSMCRDGFEAGVVIDKMCSQMNVQELVKLREKIGDNLGFEL